MNVYGPPVDLQVCPLYRSDRISRLVAVNTPLLNTRSVIEAGRSGGGGGPDSPSGWIWFGWLHVVTAGLKGDRRQSQPLAWRCSNDRPGASASPSVLLDVADAAGWGCEGALGEPLHPAAITPKTNPPTAARNAIRINTSRP